MLDYLMGFWALISIACTVVFLLLVPWMVLRKYVRIALNIVCDAVPPLSMRPRDFVPLEGEVVEFRAFDGLRLQGMFLYGNPQRRPRGTVIFAHEFKSDMYSAARYCQGMLKAGYDVFSFDFRNHGQSSHQQGYNPLQWCSDRELDDILGAIAFIQDWLERQGGPQEIGLFGISRGGSACLLAARHHPEIKAIITDGAFSADKVIEHFMKRWAGIFAKVRFVYENHPPAFWRFLRWMLFQECKRKLGVRFPSVRKALLDIETKPVLIIHGEKDGYIPVHQARLLYAAATEPKFLWIVPRAKHNQSAIVEPVAYAEKTTAFLDQYMGRETPVIHEPPHRTPGPAEPAETHSPEPSSLGVYQTSPTDS